MACENFATLCANGSSFGLCGGKTKPPPVGESGKPLTYRNTVVHRVIPKFVLQAGDFVFGNGSGGESVFGKKTFKDERAGLALKHDRQGILSMGNSGKNSNSSQFFFLLGDSASQCDGKHVIFGELKSGMEVLKAAEQFGTSSGEPTVSIMITDCGIYEPLVTPGSGYWYDKPDEESYLGISPVFMVRPRAVLLGPSQSVLEKFDFAMGSCVSIVAKISKEEVGEIVQQQAATRIIELLGDFSVDVVLIAPACKSMKSLIELPKSWAERGINVAEVVLVAKPVEAMAVIHSKSWLAKRADWQLDGKS